MGVGILWMIFKDVPLDEQLEAFANVNYTWIALSLCIAIASHWSRALRWNLLLKSLGHSPKTSTTFYAVMVGYLVNIAIPRAGEVTRCGILSQQEKIPLKVVIGTVIIERGFDLMCLILLLIFMVIVQYDLLYGYVTNLFMENLISPTYNTLSQNSTVLAITIGVLLLMIVGALVLFLTMRNNPKWLSKKETIKEMIEGFKSGLLSILKMENKGAFFMHTFFIWFGYFSMVYVCFFAMTETSILDWLDGIIVLALGSFGMVFPTPGGMGAYQFIVSSILIDLFGISEKPAGTFAQVVWFSQTFMVIVVGSLAYLMLTILRKSKEEDGEK